jgi:hypothetical protein
MNGMILDVVKTTIFCFLTVISDNTWKARNAEVGEQSHRLRYVRTSS